MDHQDFTKIARLASKAGDYDLADKAELEATHAIREAAEHRVLARERAWEDYGTVDDGFND